ATLTDEERELVNLRYESDLAHPAIAAYLGVPEGTVKVRLHRIRKRLATLIVEPL
ncbi:MAG: Sigma-70, region 4, partial [Thermoleophilaceae bacterium]|nr:Sigma-70, region 4 [Thermoleophilaceae bacterium]